MRYHKKGGPFAPTPRQRPPRARHRAVNSTPTRHPCSATDGAAANSPPVRSCSPLQAIDQALRAKSAPADRRGPPMRPSGRPDGGSAPKPRQRPSTASARGTWGRRWDVLRARGAAPHSDDAGSCLHAAARDRHPHGPRRRLGRQPRALSAEPMRPLHARRCDERQGTL